MRSGLSPDLALAPRPFDLSCSPRRSFLCLLRLSQHCPAPEADNSQLVRWALIRLRSLRAKVVFVMLQHASVALRPPLRFARLDHRWLDSLLQAVVLAEISPYPAFSSHQVIPVTLRRKDADQKSWHCLPKFRMEDNCRSHQMRPWRHPFDHVLQTHLRWTARLQQGHPAMAQHSIFTGTF